MRVFIGGKEFGDIYHAAALVAISPDHSVEIRGDSSRWQGGCDFLNAVAPDSSTIVDTPTKCCRIGASADVFYRERHRNLPNMVSEKLLSLVDDIEAIKMQASSFYSDVPSCFLWIRYGSHDPDRNLTELAFRQLLAVLQEAHVRPILIGDSAPYICPDPSNLVNFYKAERFKNNPRNQLTLLNDICNNCPVAFSIGMKSGGMDGLAFVRQFTTYYIGDPDHNKRMDKVGKAFPAFKLVPVHYDSKFIQFSTNELENIFNCIS